MSPRLKVGLLAASLACSCRVYSRSALEPADGSGPNGASTAHTDNLPCEALFEGAKTCHEFETKNSKRMCFTLAALIEKKAVKKTTAKRAEQLSRACRVGCTAPSVDDLRERRRTCDKGGSFF